MAFTPHWPLPLQTRPFPKALPGNQVFITKDKPPHGTCAHCSTPTPRAGPARVSFWGRITGVRGLKSLKAGVRDARVQSPPTDRTRHPPHWPLGTF